MIGGAPLPPKPRLGPAPPPRPPGPLAPDDARAWLMACGRTEGGHT
jgi:hypothetical protein